EVVGGGRRRAPHAGGRPAAAPPAFRWARGLARRPGRRLFLHADDIGPPGRSERLSKGGRVAVAGIGDHGGRRDLLAPQRLDLPQAHLPLPLEPDPVPHPPTPSPPP